MRINPCCGIAKPPPKTIPEALYDLALHYLEDKTDHGFVENGE